MYRSRTPPPSSRSRAARSTRSARGSTKSRRGNRGGFADRIRRAAESGPTRKWVKVMRAPAPKIRFLATKWVPINELTEEERMRYEKEQAEIQEEKQRQKLLLQQQQEQQPKESEVKEEQGSSETSDAMTTIAPQIPPESSGVDNSVTNPPCGDEERLSAEKHEAVQGTTGAAEGPPIKKAKIDEEYPVLPIS